ncbi:hypothetical protein AAVH_40979 [Aphelenchoides avenae]|nr:hypothetical protein AAVH_40979 [Aphelenchus avenae]
MASKMPRMSSPDSPVSRGQREPTPAVEEDRATVGEHEKEEDEKAKKGMWKLAAPILFYGHVMCRACRSRSYRNWVAYEDYGLTTIQKQLCARCKEANIMIMDIYRQLDGK